MCVCKALDFIKTCFWVWNGEMKKINGECDAFSEREKEEEFARSQNAVIAGDSYFDQSQDFVLIFF